MSDCFCANLHRPCTSRRARKAPSPRRGGHAIVRIARRRAAEQPSTIPRGLPSTLQMLTNFRDDVKLGLRALVHDRGFALAAVLSIGLGVGANAALFSLVDQALLRMLPVRDPERLVLLNWNGTFIGKGWGTSNLMSYPF